jgi:hypothetical protein
MTLEEVALFRESQFLERAVICELLAGNISTSWGSKSFSLEGRSGPFKCSIVTTRVCF